jgi:hypothetical protein
MITYKMYEYTYAYIKLIHACDRLDDVIEMDHREIG